MKLRRLASSALVVNLAVIVWGGYVRASGSGAGCGSHWPLCNGTIIPSAPAAATIIEYAHRITSGLALILVAWLVWRVFATPHSGRPIRRAAIASMVLIVSEALIGAGLVLLRLVGDNSSWLRALYLAGHLTNTFALLAALTTTVLLAERPETATLRTQAGHRLTLLALGLILLVGMTGAITALGDTLFPVGSLAEGLAQDRSATAHFLLRLRIIHPILATAVAGFVCWRAASIMNDPETSFARGAAWWVVVLGMGQVAVGVTNLLLLVPIWTQLVHLLFADLWWIAAVGLTVRTKWGPTGE